MPYNSIKSFFIGLAVAGGLAIIMIGGFTPHHKRHHVHGVFLKQHDDVGTFVYHSPKDDGWWYYNFYISDSPSTGAGVVPPYYANLNSLPSGGTWSKGSAPAEEEVAEESAFESYTSEAETGEAGPTELSEEGSTADDSSSDSGSDSGGDSGGDGGGDGGE